MLSTHISIIPGCGNQPPILPSMTVQTGTAEWPKLDWAATEQKCIWLPGQPKHTAVLQTGLTQVTLWRQMLELPSRLPTAQVSFLLSLKPLPSLILFFLNFSGSL